MSKTKPSFLSKAQTPADVEARRIFEPTKRMQSVTGTMRSPIRSPRCPLRDSPRRPLRGSLTLCWLPPWPQTLNSGACPPEFRAQSPPSQALQAPKAPKIPKAPHLCPHRRPNLGTTGPRTARLLNWLPCMDKCPCLISQYPWRLPRWPPSGPHIRLQMRHPSPRKACHFRLIPSPWAGGLIVLIVLMVLMNLRAVVDRP